MLKRTSQLLMGAVLTAGLSVTSVAADSGKIFVSSEKDHSVMVLSAKDYQVLKTIETAERPRHMAFNADKSKIYVACGDGESVDIIDVASLSVTDQVEDIDDPEAFDLSPDGQLLYMSLEDQGELGVIDLAEKSLKKTIEVGDEPEGVLVSPDGNTVYVTSEVANMVHVVDVKTWTLKANIVVGSRPRRMALTPDLSQLWVTSELDASVSIIDTAALKVSKRIEFKPKGFRKEDITPVGITLTADGKTAYVAMGRANHVAVVNMLTHKVDDYVLVGSRAWNTALNKDESRLFVANGLSDDISIIDTKQRKVLKSVPVGRVPYMVLVDG